MRGKEPWTGGLRLVTPSDPWGPQGSADSLGPCFLLGSAPLMAAHQPPDL